MEDYRAKRKKEGKANLTIDQEVGSAKTAINKAFDDDDGLVSGDTLKRFKKVKKYLTGKRRNSNSRKRTLTPMEFKKLVDHASPHIKPVLWIGYDTGMRKGEILSLTWGKVFLKDCVIKLRKEDTKDKVPWEIPLFSEGLCEMLNRLPRGIEENYPVFTYKGKALRDIRAGVTNACKEAGINYGRKEDGFIYHDLRRTFATDMRRAGVAESVIMEITGHSRGEVFDRYNQVNMDDMRQAVEKLTLYRRDQIASVYQNVYQVPNFGV